ncbi:3-ketoacyl-CoA synthase 7-like protein [Drosera capensis]
MEFFMLDSILRHLKILIVLALFLVFVYILRKRSRAYLIDFVCFKCPDTLRVPVSSFFEHARFTKMDRSALDFLHKVVERSGIGNEACLPLGLHLIPPDHSFNATMDEARLVMFTTVQTLLDKHKIDPQKIDILITNCSLNCPTPSLSAMISNKFGFRSNVMSFNLSGMGCSAGILALGLARDLLKVHKNSLALIVSTESICSAGYQGKDKSMLLANCLFRMGGAAILVSNRPCDRNKARYELQHIVHTHLGAKDNAYTCVYQQTDDEGIGGVSISRSVVHVAAEALKINMGTLGSLVLPYSEQIKYATSSLMQKLRPSAKSTPYVPNFKKAINHFCVHAGGKAVVDSMKVRLGLTDEDVEPSKMTLYRFGNTSSSSTWYSLCYLEAKERVKKGDIVWQLAFGSGFKCNSAVWKCIAKVSPDGSNAWFDRIHRYPVAVPEIAVY